MRIPVSRPYLSDRLRLKVPLAGLKSLAETTLDPGEEPVVAVVFETGSARAALPLARRGKAMRALTAPYTTLFVPAFPDARWAHLLA